MVAMARTDPPNARIGLHASGWSTGIDALLNTDASTDVTAHAARTAAFLDACGAGGSDFVVVEASDRDAGYYASLGRDTWWDAGDATLPTFEQALSWYRAIAEGSSKPVLLWQLPVGNTSLGNVSGAWQDNRAEYFFDHPERFAAAHVVGAAFGAGADGQTTPSSDGGYLVGRVTTYLSDGGTPACP
jgi:hypothetical protein